MHDLASWAIDTAKAAGADNCGVGLDNERLVEIQYREQKPENIKEASKKGLNIEIFVNGRYSNQSTSDLRKDSLKKFITDAVAMTRLLAEDPYRTLPDRKYFQEMTNMDLKIFDYGYDNLTPEARHELAQNIEASSLEKGGDKVISVTAAVEDSHEESVLIYSNGFEGYRKATYFSAGSQMTLQDEGDRRPNGYFYVSTVARDMLPSAAEIGLQTSNRTRDLLGGQKIKTETLPIIVENRNVARLLGGFLQAMVGWSIQQKQSFLADKKGQKVASEKFTLIDDPHIERGLGSRVYDGDGMTTRKRMMLEAGVLKEYYLDWYYSRKLGMEPTSARPSNLIIPPGARSVSEIMKDLGRGIYITGFIGGNSNPTTGDASVGIIGKLFEDGEFTQNVAEMNIADNHLEFWHKLVEAANDPWTYSSYRMPSLVFNDVVVSGV